MKLFAPEYVKIFKCIADKCRHSCCIGWEIDIDENTLARYERMPDKSIISTVEKDCDSGMCHFRLGSGGRCANLTEGGLCRIIIEHGEEYLSEICREHPRFYNRTARGLEVGIGMSCEAACKIILESDDYKKIREYGETYSETVSIIEFDAVEEREKIYGILSNSTLAYSDKISKIYELYEIPKEFFIDSERWQDALNDLEYLDESHKADFLCFDAKAKVDAPLERLLIRALAYYVYRHTSAADSMRDFRASLTLSLFLERLYATLLSRVKAPLKDETYELARIISEELEYSEDNIESLLFEIDFSL